ncbi:MAG: HAD family hydrolase [Theionarchaea archaeon]|nr:HAD family hydrolase [Theionarchaea archaeon]
MNYAAVVFDLFGTLVDIFSYSEYRRTLEEMEKILRIPPTQFVDMWSNTVHERALGLFPTIEIHISDICRRLGVRAESGDIEKAARLKLQYTIDSLHPRADTLETLSLLKSMGLKCGLVSDCSVEIPRLWPDTPFASYIDEAVFSCDVLLKKPDPRIYHLVCHRLRVEPESCLYVGDGGSYELSGAQAVGMHAVCIRVPYEDRTDAHRIEAEEWEGPVISALKEVMLLVQP